MGWGAAGCRHTNKCSADAIPRVARVLGWLSCATTGPSVAAELLSCWAAELPRFLVYYSARIGCQVRNLLYRVGLLWRRHRYRLSGWPPAGDSGDGGTAAHRDRPLCIAWRCVSMPARGKESIRGTVYSRHGMLESDHAPNSKGCHRWMLLWAPVNSDQDAHSCASLHGHTVAMHTGAPEPRYRLGRSATSIPGYLCVQLGIDADES